MVIMISGLHNSWKQSIGYFFITITCTEYDLKNIIFQTVQKLSKISFNVSNFKRLHNKTFPPRPLTLMLKTKKLFTCLIQLIYWRQLEITFSTSFKFQNKIAKTIHLENFYDSDKSKQLWLAPKLTNVHLNSNSFQKMRVKFGCHVFSHTVVAGMTILVSCNELLHNTFNTIDFIDSMDKLFVIPSLILPKFLIMRDQNVIHCHFQTLLIRKIF